MSPLAQQIEAIIHTAVDNATVYINDPDGQHLQATVISPTFNGMPLVRQHQLVLNALKQTFAPNSTPCNCKPTPLKNGRRE
jgi:acid stress-induced BolA-like protein IbaG/YrbA